MNQEFIVGPFKITEEEGKGISVSTATENDGWEAVATFKYPVDAVKYFNELTAQLVDYQPEQ